MTTIRALLVSGRKLELELELSHTRLGPPVRYEYSTPTSYTSVILALPTATRRVAPRPPPSRCASPRPRQCQSVTPPPSPPVVPAPSVRAGFPGNSLTTRRTPRQRKDDSGPGRLASLALALDSAAARERFRPPDDVPTSYRAARVVVGTRLCLCRRLRMEPARRPAPLRTAESIDLHSTARSTAGHPSEQQTTGGGSRLRAG